MREDRNREEAGYSFGGATTEGRKMLTESAAVPRDAVQLDGVRLGAARGQDHSPPDREQIARSASAQKLARRGAEGDAERVQRQS